MTPTADELFKKYGFETHAHCAFPAMSDDDFELAYAELTQAHEKEIADLKLKIAIKDDALTAWHLVNAEKDKRIAELEKDVKVWEGATNNLSEIVEEQKSDKRYSALVEGLKKLPVTNTPILITGTSESVTVTNRDVLLKSDVEELITKTGELK